MFGVPALARLLIYAVGRLKAGLQARDISGDEMEKFGEMLAELKNDD